MSVLPDNAVVSCPYVSYEGGTRVLVVAAGGEAWYRIETWAYAVARWYWQADARTMREVSRYVRPGELVDADSAELWANVDPSLPAHIARARLHCEGRALKLHVPDSGQLREWQYDPYAPLDLSKAEQVALLLQATERQARRCHRLKSTSRTLTSW